MAEGETASVVSKDVRSWGMRKVEMERCWRGARKRRRLGVMVVEEDILAEWWSWRCGREMWSEEVDFTP